MAGKKVIKAGIMGATGYTGAELVRLLRGRGGVEIEMMTSTSRAGERYGDIFERFSHTDYVLEADGREAMAERCDVAFLALPHGISAEMIDKAFTDKCAVIDLGADFRLRDTALYKEWYELEHPADSSAEKKEVLSGAVYGLCEIYREDIKKARVTANPGCYTTCSILALYPLLKAGLIKPDGIVIDAKSGASGAGRGASVPNIFCEVDESVRPYKIASHRHTPEIEQELSLAAGRGVRLTFTPQVVPMERGILACSYAMAENGAQTGDLLDCLNKAYKDEPFIRVMRQNKFPETKNVGRTNFCDIGAAVDKRTGRAVVISALDNLVKGASGQALQNMNIIFGEDETRGLLT